MRAGWHAFLVCVLRGRGEPVVRGSVAHRHDRPWPIPLEAIAGHIPSP